MGLDEALRSMNAIVVRSLRNVTYVQSYRDWPCQQSSSQPHLSDADRVETTPRSERISAEMLCEKYALRSARNPSKDRQAGN